jgi:hypothetical protein
LTRDAALRGNHPPNRLACPCGRAAFVALFRGASLRLCCCRIMTYLHCPRVPDGWLAVPLLPPPTTFTLCLNAAPTRGRGHNSWQLRTIRTRAIPAR